MPTVRASLVVFICLLACIGPAKSQEDPADTAVDDAKEWFDGLGYDLLRPFVCVATGGWSRSGNREPEKEFRCGFLQEADADGFRVLLTDLSERTYSYSPAGTEELERVYYEAAKLDEFAEASLAAAKDPEHDSWRRFGERLSERSEFFVIARACELAGFPESAVKLYGQARSSVGKDDADLCGAIKNDLAYSRIWALTLRCGYPSVTRESLEADFAAFLTHFDGTEYLEKAKEIHGQLVVMVAEDAAHKAGIWEQMTTDQKVAELIYQLRDQNGEQWSQPGSCDIFDDERGEESPAHGLAAMGFDAVPQLIEVVDDLRLTRSIGYWRDFTYSHHILRVGDCAIAILARISGRNFYERTYTNGYPLKDGKGSAIKQEAAAWWADVQERGIDIVLAEGVEKGDRNSPSQAAQLANIDPLRAFEAIRKGVKAADDYWVKEWLVDIAGGLGEEVAGEFIRDQLTGGSGLGTRLDAARILNAWGDTIGVVAMIDEWKRQSWELSGGGHPGIEGLVEFLLSSGDIDAAKAVAESVDGLTVSERREIVDAACDLDGAGESLQRPFGAVVEKMLVARLDDNARTSMSGSRTDWHFTNPAIAEFALYALGRLWPTRYPALPAAGRFARVLQFVRAKNTWRASQGLEPLAEPTRPEVKPADAQILEKLWAKARSDDPGKSVAELEALGLSALAFVSSRLKDSDAADDKLAPLFALERRLSLIVREVKFEAGGVDAADGLKAAIAAATGKTLDASLLELLLADCIANLPKGAEGFDFVAWRDDDGCGVTIEFVLKPGSHVGRGWDRTLSARLAGDGLLNSSGTGIDSILREDDAFQDFRKPMGQIGASDPRDPFEVQLDISSN